MIDRRAVRLEMLIQYEAQMRAFEQLSQQMLSLLDWLPSQILATTDANVALAGSKSFSASKTGIRACTSATNLFGSQIIIVHDLSVSPLTLSCHSSQRPAIVSAGEPSRAVKYQGCLPLGVPFVIARHRNEAAIALERLTKERLLRHRLGTGVKRRQL
jgi:hypothetical protein